MHIFLLLIAIINGNVNGYPYAEYQVTAFNPTGQPMAPTAQVLLGQYDTPSPEVLYTLQNEYTGELSVYGKYVYFEPLYPTDSGDSTALRAAAELPSAYPHATPAPVVTILH